MEQENEIRRPLIKNNTFPADVKEASKRAQADSYPVLAPRLYYWPIARYLDACELLGIKTVLARQLEALQFPDNAVLRRIYNLIAVYYRNLNEDYGQLRLFNDGGQTYHEINYIEQLEDTWKAYFDRKSKELFKIPTVTIALVTAFANANEHQGLAA